MPGWRNFFVEDVRAKAIPANLETRLFRKLQMLDDATTDADLRTPPSNHFEKLKGTLAGWHSIRVNEQWLQMSISTITVIDEVANAYHQT
jgi:toxin HigB-1